MNLPNVLTTARGVLAVAFFVVLAPALRWERAPAGAGAAEAPPTLLPALAIFLVAVATDFFDGWLARRWKATSPYGREADPFMDKVLVLGSLVLLACYPAWGVSIVAVALILAREFLVTGMRAIAESRGIAFGALPGGKIKMGVQAAAVIWVLVVTEAVVLAGRDYGERASWIAPVIWTAAAVTVASAVPYVRKSLETRTEALR